MIRGGGKILETYYAHSTENPDKSGWQRLAETEEVFNRSREK